MARPKKLESAQMIQIVDAYFTTEAAGNPNRLKCSLLESYANRQGYSVKAYDFRRDEQVREHIESLKKIVQGEMGTRFLAGDSYKSLDVEDMVRAMRNPMKLRKMISELDEYWRDVYNSSLKIMSKNKELVQSCQEEKKDKKELENKSRHEQEETERHKKENRQLIIENRYLRKMLRTYLYPAIANEILMKERVLDSVDTKVTKEAVQNFSEEGIPLALTDSVKVDCKTRNHEADILAQMWEQVERESE